MDANTKFQFPLYLPGNHCDKNKNKSVLSIDLRAESCRFAKYSCVNDTFSKDVERIYATKEFSSLVDLVNQFNKDHEGVSYDRISVAVPGPVMNGKCVTPNLPWILDAKELSAALNVEKVLLVNDLEATAYGYANFNKDSLEILHTSEEKIRGNVAILAPGRGLGEAGLFFDGEYLRPFATEGGHTEFSPRNDYEVQFYQFLNKIYGIVTWEHVLSKEGLYNIYRFLRDIGRHEESPELKERMKNEHFIDVMIAVGEEKSSRLVNITLEMYAEFLAREANNLVLKLKATGGLILTGNISRKFFHLFDKKTFYKNFLISDRMEHILKDIPIYIIRNKDGVIDGAAVYGAFIEE